jgi:RNA polymerase sigma factor (sigma-70 family)
MPRLLATYTDEELLLGCRENDSRYQQRFYERFYGKMMSLCSRYCNNREDAEELLNTGFLKVFHNLNTFKSQGSLEGWIRKIILNTILESHRRNIKYKEIIKYPDFEQDESVDNGIISHLYAEDLINLISRLPASSRLVFNLFVIEGYSHNEIADLLNISTGTTKWHVSFAKDKLKKMILASKLNETNYVNAG